MPFITVTTSAKQFHSMAYWKEGFYDEPVLLHLGSPMKPPVDDVIRVLKARPLTALPKDICLHWESNFDLSSVLDVLEERNFQLMTSAETNDRVSYVFKFESVKKAKQENGVQNGVTNHQTNGDLSPEVMENLNNALFPPPKTNGNGNQTNGDSKNGILDKLKMGYSRSLSTTSSTTSSQGSRNSLSGPKRKRVCQPIIWSYSFWPLIKSIILVNSHPIFGLTSKTYDLQLGDSSKAQNRQDTT